MQDFNVVQVRGAGGELTRIVRPPDEAYPQFPSASTHGFTWDETESSYYFTPQRDRIVQLGSRPHANTAKIGGPHLVWAELTSPDEEPTGANLVYRMVDVTTFR